MNQLTIHRSNQLTNQLTSHLKNKLSNQLISHLTNKLTNQLFKPSQHHVWTIAIPCWHLHLLTYFTLVGVVSSDVSRSSSTTSFPPCCSIFSHSHVYFQGCHCPLLDVIYVLHPGAPSSSFPRNHSENASLYKITLIVYACMSKESHFSFANLGKEFASSLKFIQYALVCPFLRPTYPQHSSVAPHFSCF